MSVDFIRDNVLLFGPGFVFVKLVYLFGEQHRRVEWEWLVWSLIAGLPIAFTADWIATGVWPVDIPAANDPAHARLRFGIAVGAALGVAIIWRLIRHRRSWPIQFLRRSLSDSAWDLVLDTAVSRGCGIAVTVERMDDAGVKREASYYGSLAAFGYEAAAAEPIVFLKWVQRWDPEKHEYVAINESPEDGMVFHRDSILRMRIVGPKQKVGRLRAWLRAKWAWFLARLREVREAVAPTGLPRIDGRADDT